MHRLCRVIITKIEYRPKGLVLQKKNLLLGDLVGYRVQREGEAMKKLNALSGDRKYLSAIVNVARKSPSTMGVTVDTVLAGLETALSMEIFSFKINGVDPFKLIQDELKNDEFVIQVYMNNMFFSAEVALKQGLMPGFRRKPLDEAYLEEKVKKASRAWKFQFERGIKDYVDFKNCEIKILEE